MFVFTPEIFINMFLYTFRITLKFEKPVYNFLCIYLWSDMVQVSIFRNYSISTVKMGQTRYRTH